MNKIILSKICDINRKIPYENNKWNTQNGKWELLYGTERVAE